MNTPIFDFVTEYNNKNFTRFHMPGHKGQKILGCEALDITEIKGADVLNAADGIIAESRRNTSALFDSGAVFYSTEGSSLCIKSMLAAVLEDTKRLYKISNKNSFDKDMRFHVLAARNVHRAMIDGCALIDLDVDFIMPDNSTNICTGIISASDVDRDIRKSIDKRESVLIGVYITSPDYLGNIADIKGIAQVCSKYNIPLMVDNAHGAYLAFLKESLHPIVLGAAMCCDSAHKTLPVLTGGAYLHISEKYKEKYEDKIDKFFSLFGSTSPSYLILQSLDLCNKYISEGYRKKLKRCIEKINEIKSFIYRLGINVMFSEPLKIIIDTAVSGYTGNWISEELRTYKIECEYSDMNYIVLMLTPDNSDMDFERLKCWAQNTCLVTERREKIEVPKMYAYMPKRAISIREAVFSSSKIVEIKDAGGCVCAAETISCPPAVPIAVSGEIIDASMIKLFREYNIKKVCVVS